MTEAAEPRTPKITCLEGVRDARSQLVDDVREGLTAATKRLPPRHFYDARGSELFEAITHVPEYYLTRAETEILERVARAIVDRVRPVELAEIGSGSSRKTRLLLEAMHELGTGGRYVALDVSESALRAAADVLVRDYDWIDFEGVVGDFHEHLGELPRRGRRLLALLGSTVGNLDVEERREFLGSIGSVLTDGDRFLIGVDLVKDPAVLVAAYDDAQGVTAAFNLNLLAVLDRELDADFRLEDFEHVARWNPEAARMEMSLRARRSVSASIPGAGIEVRFAEGEEMLTEISCKFTRPRVEDELARAGMRLEGWDEDEAGRFALALCAAAP